MIELTIPGKPIAKKRPRFASRNIKKKNGKSVTITQTYNDQLTEEGKFLLSVREQVNEQPIRGPVVMGVIFYMPIPKYLEKKMGLIKDGLIPHTKKPDLDNLLKFAMDCLNGEAWTDDSQVVEFGRVAKLYDPNPRTEIKLFNWETIQAARRGRN